MYYWHVRKSSVEGFSHNILMKLWKLCQEFFESVRCRHIAFYRKCHKTKLRQYNSKTWNGSPWLHYGTFFFGSSLGTRPIFLNADENH